MPPGQLAEPSGHPRNPIGVLAGRGPRDRGQDGRGERLGPDLFEGVGIGERGVLGLERRRLHVDERPGDALADRRADGRDHALAGVDGDVAEPVAIAVGVGLEHGRDHGQPLDGGLHIVLERRRQGDGQAVVRPGQQLLAGHDREVARPMHDRQDADFGPDGEEVVGARTVGCHDVIRPHPRRLRPRRHRGAWGRRGRRRGRPGPSGRAGRPSPAASCGPGPGGQPPRRPGRR